MKQHYEYSFTSEEEEEFDTLSKPFYRPEHGPRLSMSPHNSDVDTSIFSLRAMPDGTVGVFPLSDTLSADPYHAAKFDLSQLTHTDLIQESLDTLDPQKRYYNFLNTLTQDNVGHLPIFDLQHFSQNRPVDAPEIPDEFQIEDPVNYALDRENTHKRHSDELSDEKATTIAQSLLELSPGDRISFGGGIKPHTIVCNEVCELDEFFYGHIAFFPDDPIIESNDHDTDTLKRYRSQNPEKSNLEYIEVSVRTDESTPPNHPPILTIHSQSTTVYGHNRELGLITDVTLKEPSHSAVYPYADYIAEIEWICDPDPA